MYACNITARSLITHAALCSRFRLNDCNNNAEALAEEEVSERAVAEQLAADDCGALSGSSSGAAGPQQQDADGRDTADGDTAALPGGSEMRHDRRILVPSAAAAAAASGDRPPVESSHRRTLPEEFIPGAVAEGSTAQRSVSLFAGDYYFWSDDDNDDDDVAAGAAGNEWYAVQYRLRNSFASLNLRASSNTPL